MLWADLPAPEGTLRDVVVLPVRNEAERLPAALAALAAQTELDGSALDRRSYEILLLANNCDDASAAAATAFAAAHADLRLHVVETRFGPSEANIGHVRRTLMDEACRRLESLGRAQGLIASTDGDTRVGATWLAANRREAARGADAIGGRILTDGDAQQSGAARRSFRLDLVHALLRARLECRLDAEPIDVWPRHHQHFGASLAVTADAYRRAGGVPRVEVLEDEALYHALRRADQRVRHSPAVRVVTSARLDGRAPVGLSWQLRQWADGPIHDPPVDPPHRIIAVLRARSVLRRRWRCRGHAAGAQGVDWAGHEDALSLPPRTLARLEAESSTLGAAFAALDDLARRADSSMVPMSTAVAEMRRWLRRGQARAGSATNRSNRYCAARPPWR